MTPVSGSCANCAEPLTGDFCSHCGQQAIDLHRPFSDLFSDVGRRMSHVPPLKAYLIAALIFFSLFTIFPSEAPVRVFVQGSAEERAAKNERGSRTFFSLPPSVSSDNDWYQGAVARAMRQPEAFAHAVYSNVPRAFFFLLPLFALFLELLYRKQGYLIDHLVVSLYYHVFVFLNLTGAKLVSLGVLYVLAFFTVVPVIFGVALLQF